MEELCRHLTTPYFKTSMKRSNVVPLCGRSKDHPVQLLIPVGFINEHADKIQLRCILQAEASGEVWSVNLWASAAQNEVKISRGWKAFASSNELKIGDQLLFSLTAMSKFVVYIFDFAGSVKEPRRAPLISCYKICNCNCQDCKAWHDLWNSKNLSRNEQNEEASAPSLSLSNKETVSGYAMHPATTNSSKRCTNGDKVLLEGASQLVSKETPAVKTEINIAQSHLPNKVSRPKRTTGDQTGTEIGNFAGSSKKTSPELFFPNFDQVPPVASVISRFPGAGETLTAWSSHEMAHQHEPLLDCRVPANTVEVEEECHPTRSNCFDKPRISQQVHAKMEKPVFQRSSSVTPTFQKTLTFTHLEGQGYKTGVQMEIPVHFMRLHGHQLPEMMTLQGPGGYQSVAIKHSVSYPSRKSRTYFRGGWSQFVDQNSLKEGDKLLFILTGPSSFHVEIMRRRRSLFTVQKAQKVKHPSTDA